MKHIKQSRGAAVTEYAILAALLGSVSLFVVLDFGSTATSTYTAQASVIETQLEESGLQIGGVLGDGGIYINTNEPAGGGIFVNTNEPPPAPPVPPVEPPFTPTLIPVLFSWWNGATANIMPGAGTYALQDFPTGWLANAYLTAGVEPGTTQTFAFSMNTPGGPFVQSSALGITVREGARTMNILLPEAVENASFRIGHFNGRATPRAQETVLIQGTTLDGRTIAPSTSAAFVSHDGNGVFSSSCSPTGTTLQCAADFVFSEDIEEITITFYPLPMFLQMGGPQYTWTQIIVSDIYGTIWE